MTEPKPVLPRMDNLRKFERPKATKPNTQAEPANSLFSQPEPIAVTATPMPQDEPEHFRQLGIEEIQQYPDNPRTQPNPMYPELKESFRIGGIDTVVLIVTKCPGDALYTVSVGGNTRLKIIQELWAETQDMRFRAVRCVIQRFESHEHMLAAAAGENALRGDLCFWDSAAVIVKFRKKLVAVSGSDLSMRDFVEKAKEYRLSINITTLSFYEFAVRTYGHLEFSQHLSYNMIQKLQPLWSGIERLEKLSARDVATPVEELLQALDQQWFETVGIDFDQLLKELNLAVSTALGLSLAEFPKALELSKDRSLNDWDKLLQRLRMAKPAVARPERTQSAMTAVMALAARSTAQPNDLVVPAASLAALQPQITTDDPKYPNETLIERILRLAQTVARWHDFESNVVACDVGVGFFLEPLVNEILLQPQTGHAYQVTMNVWNILALLSCQWHPAQIKVLPKTALWTRLMTTSEVLKFERSCLAVLPPAHLSWAEHMLDQLPYHQRHHFMAARNGSPVEMHDWIMDLSGAIFQLMREQPERFAHVPNRMGTPKILQETWE